MSEKKSKKFTIGLVLIILGILFLLLLFQIIAFTGTVFFTPQAFNDDLETKFKKDEVKEGDSWWVYGWIHNKTELSKEDQDVIGYKFVYLFKANIASKMGEEDEIGFLSNNSYIAGTDILVEIEIKGGMFVEANRLAFPVPELPGIIILIIGVILFSKGKKLRKMEKEKFEKEQGNMFSQGDMAGFTQSQGGFAPPGQLSQQIPAGGGYAQSPAPLAQQPFSSPPPGGFSGVPSQPQQPAQFPQRPPPATYGQPPGTPAPGYQSGPMSAPQPSAPQPSMPQPTQPTPMNLGAPQSTEIHQGNVGVPMYVKCPACGEKMPAPAIRPARVQCQKCGTKGTIN